MTKTATLSDGSSVRISHVGRCNDGRQRYRWDAFGADGARIAGDNDLSSGVGAPIDLPGTLETFAGFLGAWVESFGYPGSENADLFPAVMRDWAERNADELDALVTFTA